MTLLDEYARYVRLHAGAQGIGPRERDRVLAQITTADDGPGGWADVWTAEAEREAEAGRLPGAIARDVLARFPGPVSDGRRQASTRAAARFAEWAATGVAEKLEVKAGSPGGATAWFSDTGARGPVPLVLVVGGIVSPKEQWGRLLPALRRVGLAAVVTELPGVGTTPGLLGAESHRHLDAVIDAVTTRTRVSGVYCLAMSHGGTVALRTAARDPRIRGIVTVGAPVHYTYSDPEVLRLMPDVTRQALECVTGRTGDALEPHLADLAPAPAELDRVVIPVRYIRSERDELVPAAEADLLGRHLGDLRVIDLDDVHGSPGHPLAVRAHALASLLQMIRPDARGTRALSGVLSLAARLPGPLSPIDLGRERSA